MNKAEYDARIKRGTPLPPNAGGFPYIEMRPHVWQPLSEDCVVQNVHMKPILVSPEAPEEPITPDVRATFAVVLPNEVAYLKAGWHVMSPDYRQQIIVTGEDMKYFLKESGSGGGTPDNRPVLISYGDPEGMAMVGETVSYAGEPVWSDDAEIMSVEHRWQVRLVGETSWATIDGESGLEIEILEEWEGGEVRRGSLATNEFGILSGWQYGVAIGPIEAIPTVPEQVGALVFTDATPTGFVVEFDLPEDGGRPITGKRIVVRATGGANVFDETFGVDDPVEVSGLEPGGDYEVQAYVQNLVGWSTPSAWQTVSTPAVVPSVPTVSVSGTTHNGTTVVVTLPSDDGGADITNKRVVVRLAGGATVSDETYAVADTVEISALTPETDYEVQAYVQNSAGWSEASTWVAFVTDIEPFAPVLVTPPSGVAGESAAVGVEIQSDDGVWEAYPTSVTYEHRWQRRTGAGAAEVVAGATTNSYTPVVADVGYQFRKQTRATNSAGVSEWLSDQEDQWSLVVEPVVPAAPETASITFSDIGEGSFSVDFTLPTNTGGAPITHRGVQVQSMPDEIDVYNEETPVAQTPVVISGLQAGTEYRVRVRATNSAGQSPASGWASTNTLEEEEPEPDPEWLRTPNTSTQSSIHSGHSLTDAYIQPGGATWPGSLRRIAEDNGLITNETQLIKSTIPGAPLHYRWDNRVVEAGLEADARWDIDGFRTLMITEGGPPPHPDTLDDMSNTLDYLCRFAANQIENGAGDDLVLWSIWPALEGAGAPDPHPAWQGVGFRDGLDLYTRSFMHMRDYTEWKMRGVYNLEDYRVWLIPGSEWMARVYDDIQNGLVPGITNIEQLFADDDPVGQTIHTRQVAGYGMALFVLSCLYHKEWSETDTYPVEDGLTTPLLNYFIGLANDLSKEFGPAGRGGSQGTSLEFDGSTDTDPLPGWSFGGGGTDPEPNPGGVPADAILTWTAADGYDGPALSAGDTNVPVANGRLQFDLSTRTVDVPLTGFYIAGDFDTTLQGSFGQNLAAAADQAAFSWSTPSLTAHLVGNEGDFWCAIQSRNPGWDDGVSEAVGTEQTTTASIVELAMFQGNAMSAMNGIGGNTSEPSNVPTTTRLHIMGPWDSGTPPTGGIQSAAFVIMDRMPTEQERVDIRAWIESNRP